MARVSYSVFLASNGEPLRTKMPARNGKADIRFDVAAIQEAYPGRQIRVNIYEGDEMVESTLLPNGDSI